MTMDVEAKELKVGDKVLVEMKVVRIIELPSRGRIGVFLAHREDDDQESWEIRSYTPDESVEIHSP